MPDITGFVTGFVGDHWPWLGVAIWIAAAANKVQWAQVKATWEQVNAGRASARKRAADHLRAGMVDGKLTGNEAFEAIMIIATAYFAYLKFVLEVAVPLVPLSWMDRGIAWVITKLDPTPNA